MVIALLAFAAEIENRDRQASKTAGGREMLCRIVAVAALIALLALAAEELARAQDFPNPSTLSFQLFPTYGCRR